METDKRSKMAAVFCRNPRPNSGTPDLIASLPPELRNRIYELSLSDSLTEVTRKKRNIVTKKFGIGREPPLLKTCKQIRREAAPMYYRHFPLYLRLGNPCTDLATSKIIRKIRSTVAWCGPKPFQEVKIIASKGAWLRLSELLPLLECMRSTGFEPDVHENEPNALGHPSGVQGRNTTSIFQLPWTYTALQRTLNEALALGRKARDEKWTQERLAVQFGTWQKKAQRTRGQQRKGKKTCRVW